LTIAPTSNGHVRGAPKPTPSARVRCHYHPAREPVKFEKTPTVSERKFHGGENKAKPLVNRWNYR